MFLLFFLQNPSRSQKTMDPCATQSNQSFKFSSYMNTHLNEDKGDQPAVTGRTGDELNRAITYAPASAHPSRQV